MYKRNGFTILELLAVVLLIAVLIILMMPMLGRAVEESRRQACADNMRQIGMALKMYTLDNKAGMFPPMLGQVAATRDCSAKGAPPTGKTQSFVAPIFDVSLLYPNYLSDLTLLACPSNRSHDRNALKKNSAGNVPATLPCATGPNWTNAGDSYTYLGWYFDKISDAADETMSVATYLKEVPSTLDPNGCPGIPNTATLALQPAALYMNRLAKFRALEKSSPGQANQVWGEDVDLASTKHLNTNWMALCSYGGTVWVGNHYHVENVIQRLQKGVSAKGIADLATYSGSLKASSEIEILWDDMPSARIFRHLPAGVNVLFLDGHVEVQRYAVFDGVASDAYANFVGCVID